MFAWVLVLWVKPGVPGVRRCGQIVLPQDAVVIEGGEQWLQSEMRRAGSEIALGIIAASSARRLWLATAASWFYWRTR